MKRYYCTYFDRNYLVKGIALIQSLNKHEKNDFELFVICMDEITHVILGKLNLPNVTVIPVHQIEQDDSELLETKRDRTDVEYYWTMTSTIILRILENNSEIDILTYVDADLFFFSSPEPIFNELGEDSILIHEHRFTAELAHYEENGKYNVGLLCFRNDTAGLEALKWWRERCIEWCYHRLEDGKIGDQAYLNDWPTRFEGVRVLENIGAGLAPWNHYQYQYSIDEKNNVFVNQTPVVFYHFHAFQFVNTDVVIPTNAIYPLTMQILKWIFVPYVNTLSEAINIIKTIVPDFAFGLFNNNAPVASSKLIAKHQLSSAIQKLGIQQEPKKLTDDWDFYGSDQPISSPKIQKASLELWSPERAVDSQYDLFLELNGRLITKNIRTLFVIGAFRFEEEDVFFQMFPNLQKIYLFEPLSDIYDYLVKSTNSNPVVEVFPYALSDFNGQTQLFLTDNMCSSSLLPLGKHLEIFPYVKPAGTIPVECRTLDNIIEQHDLSMPDMLFIDVQGAEYKILSSLSSALRSHISLIYTEVSKEELYLGARLLDDIKILLEPDFNFVGYAPHGPDTPTHGNAFFVNHRNAELLRYMPDIKSIEINPNTVSAHNKIGKLYLEKGLLANALKHFTKALHIDPYDHNTVLNCGRLLATHGQLASAATLYNSYLQQKPHDIDVIQAMKNLNNSKTADIDRDIVPRNEIGCEAVSKNTALQHNQMRDDKSKYLVSAIVSTYNSERFIRGCLENLESQTIVEKLEIIVVNSGSQQNEESIVKEFQQKYDNIKYIKTEERETIYAAWNRAIKAASGKYIANANTDDIRYKNALEIMARTLDENPDKVLVYANQIEFDEIDGQRVSVGEWKNGEFSKARLFAGHCPPGPQPMWRKDVHDGFGYFDKNFVIGGDYEFWFRLTQKYDFLYIDKILGERNVSAETVTRSNYDIMNWEAEMVIRKCYEYALQEDITIGATGISEHPLFSNWPEINIWKQNTKARLENRQISLHDNIKANWDFRTNPSPKITIVVVTYYRHKDLLENLYALNEQNEKDFEVIVVDNGGDLSWLKQHTDEFKFELCGIELEINFGPSPAKNIGTDFAKAEYIAFLDDDAVAEKNLISNIVKHFKSHNISGIRGKVLPKNQTKPENIPANYDLGDQIINTACEVSCLSAFRKDILIKMGGFDELLFGSEGMELSYRICKSQKEKMLSILYFPDVSVYHNFNLKGLARTEKTLRQERMEVLAWRKENCITGYKEHIHSLYPGNKAIFENSCNNYSWIINIVIYLSNVFPEEAVEWAKKAVTLNPERFKGCYLLGSLYTSLSKYDKALPLLERIYEPLHNCVLNNGNEFVSSEFDDKVDISECYIKTCTQLAQCYMQTNQYVKLKQIYRALLNNQNLTLAQEQKEDVLNVLRKLDNIPSLPAITENKVIVSAKTENDYLISAIISTYNSEKFLSGCLEDLEHQTISDKLEIIVVNSGSQENEEAIVQEFQHKYDNIVYIKTEQREGIYTAWNRAVKVARGTFLTNANTDDRHRDDALEIMAETLLANPDIALVYGDQICTDTPNGTFADYHVTNMAKRPEYSFERLLFGCCVGSQPMWRKTLHNEFGYFDETLACASDWDFWLRISREYKFKHIPDFLGLYYHNEGGIEHSRKIHSLYERYKIGRRYGNPYISVIPLYNNINNPLVSVITPAYNAAKHIAETIESVLIQNYRNFELIIVDDGSVDNTRDIISGFKDDKIKYFYQDNCGPSSARNMAISKSRGQYIIPLDADDMMTPDFIAKHLQEFEMHPEADLIYCDDYLIDENSKPIRVINRPEYKNTRMLIRNLFHCGFPIVPFRTCFRKSALDKIGLFDEELLVGEDYDMIRRFVRHGLKMHHLQNALYLRRMTNNSLSKKYSIHKAKCHFEVIKRFADTFTYDELFPDVAWNEIEPGIRQLHAKCLIAGTYLAIGQEYVKSNALEYSKTAFDRACSELNDCIKINPENQELQRLFQKSQLIRARYAGAPRQVVSQEM